MTPSNSAAVNSAAVNSWPAVGQSTPLASWYAEGLCDGIGDRLSMFDNSGTPSLELLRFRPMLAGVPGFEEALRRRVDRLRAFDHPAFSRIRAVERLEGGGLALVSTFTAGKRVGEIFWSPQARTGVHPAFAAWLIRELTAALAELHRQGSDIAHAALSPDRVVLTPDGRLVILEHVIGAALDRLRMSVGRLRQTLGVVAVEGPGGGAKLDQRTDVVQIAWLALSLLLGRRVSPLDYPHRVEPLLEEFVAIGRVRSPVLVRALHRWLRLALDATPAGFASAVQAEEGLGELRVPGAPHTTAFAARTPVEQLAFAAPFELPPLTSMPDNDDRATPTDMWAPGDGTKPSTPETRTMAMATEFASDVLESPVHEQTPAAAPPAAKRSRAVVYGWLAAAAFAAIAAGEAVWIGRIGLARTSTAPAAPQPIVLDSLQPGDAVLVDGREIGVTPLKLTLSPAVRSVMVSARAPIQAAERPAPTPTPAVEHAANTSAAALVLAAARDRRGGLRISSPIELQVLEGERVLGSSVDGPVVTTAGRHELDFVNSALGYKSRQVVEVRAGQIIPMKISPPDGRVSVNAVPWAQVLINGTPVGETPLANLPLAVGEHEIVFRHPQLGEQTQKVIVKSNALTRVSASFTR